MSKIKRFLQSKLLAYFVFFGWNVFGIICLIALESEGHMVYDLIQRVSAGLTPVSYLMQMIGILLIPILGFVVGILVFRKDHKRLIHWFYGVQIPLLTLGIIRIGAVNTMTDRTAGFLIFAFVGVLIYAIYLIRNKLPQALLTMARVVWAVLGLHVTLILLLMVIPMIALFIEAVPEMLDALWHSFFEATFMGVVGAIFGSITATLFVFSPLAFIQFFVIDSIRGLIDSLRAGRNWVYLIIALAFTVYMEYTHQMAHEKADSLIEQWEAKAIDAQAIQANESVIREGLTEAYLSREMFLEYQDEPSVIFYLWKEAAGMELDWPEWLYDGLMNPLTFKGDWQSRRQAASEYESLFDVPIERAELERIKDTHGSTLMRRGMDARLLDIGAEAVEVTRKDQYVQASDHPGYVTLTYHERYLNRTYRQKEIFYNFSMPEGGVVTAMYLGDSDEDSMRYEHRIAGRGAAQQVYNEEKQRRRDPSLLEQVGPQQFRLRVFPIPAREYDYHEGREAIEERPMHLTLKFLLRIGKDGRVDVPQLIERRNVFPSEHIAPDLDPLEAGPWIEPIETDLVSWKPMSASVDGYQMTYRSQLEKGTEFQEKLVLCIDGSYSMNSSREQLVAALDAFPYQAQTQLVMHQQDTLITLSWEKPLDYAFVGTADPGSIVYALNQQYPNHRILYLTDKGNYELLPESSRKAMNANNRFDLVHLGGYAAIYEDALIDYMYSGGGHVYRDMDEWVYWQRHTYDPKSEIPDGHGVWNFKPLTGESSADSFKRTNPALVAKYINWRSLHDSLSTSEKDKLNQLAQAHSFVSLYSSMICLVSEAQHRRLDELEQSDDRFDREVETGKTLNMISDNSAIGVPEPEEWILLISSLILLFFLYRKKLQARMRLRRN